MHSVEYEEFFIKNLHQQRFIKPWNPNGLMSGTGTSSGEISRQEQRSFLFSELLKRQHSPAIQCLPICQEMAEISDLSDDLLVKILSFLPTKDAVSTSILSKQWKFLWMWCPVLVFDDINNISVRDFINKNLPLHRAPIIKCLRLESLNLVNRTNQADDFKTWVRIAVSRGLQELTIWLYSHYNEVLLSLPSTLYTCNSLVTLTLGGKEVLVDVPENVCLTSLKKLHLSSVTYSNGDSLRLLLSCCLILEYLIIRRQCYDNVEAFDIIISSLQRLSLSIVGNCSDDGCVIVTPSLKFFKVWDCRVNCSYSFGHMPEIEEADIVLATDSYLEDIFKSISTVKSLSLQVSNNVDNEAVYGDGIVFSKLENLNLYKCSENWSKITFKLLKDSPNLQELYIGCAPFHVHVERLGEYELGWINNQNLVPECLLKSLKDFEFGVSTKKEEEKDFLSFIIEHACCLESISIH